MIESIDARDSIFFDAFSKLFLAIFGPTHDRSDVASVTWRNSSGLERLRTVLPSDFVGRIRLGPLRAAETGNAKSSIGSSWPSGWRVLYAAHATR